MRSENLLHFVICATLALSGCAPADGDAGRQQRTDSSVAESQPAAPAPATGLDPVIIDTVFARAARMPRLYSLLVARHGDIVREQYFNGRTAERRANMKSASKSIVSAAVGIAIAEGHLEGTSQPIAPFFPEYVTADADPRMQQVTIGTLLSMQSGLEPTSFGNYGRWVASSNWIRSALTRPFVDEPGGRMLYSTGSTHILSGILTRATGISTHAYMRDRIFRPLGIELAPWTRDPQGVYFGGNEMHLRPRELFVFGEMYRNGGRHEARQIVPESWIRDSWTQRTSSPFNGHGYGLGWWMRRSRGHDVYFAWGYGGQYLFIVPALELTVVMTSDAVSPREGDHNRELHRLLDRVVQAAERGGA